MAEQSGTPSVTWANSLQTRNGTLTVDSKLVNAFVEPTTEGKCIRKRPGTVYETMIGGKPQGQFTTSATGLSSLYYIVANTLYDLATNTPIALPSANLSTYAVSYNVVLQGDSSLMNNALLQQPGFPGSPTTVGHLLLFDGTNIVPVTDTNYPSTTALGVVTLDEVTYVMAGNGEIHGSVYQNPGLWPALDFIAPDRQYGMGMGIFRHLNYIAGFYEKGLILYYDANAAPNGQGIALAPVTNAYWKTGCLSPYSVATVNNATFFLSQDDAFGRTVQMLDGLTLTRVSSPAVERILNTVPALTTASGFDPACPMLIDAWGSGLRVSGHQIYMLTLPTIQCTLVFDLDARDWYVWSSVVGGVEQCFVGRSHSNDSRADHFQDYTTGRTFKLSATAYTDATGVLPVTAVTPEMDWGTMNWKRFARMSQRGDTVNSSVQVSFSDDDYTTFSTPRSIDLSTVRKELRNCGRSRRRAWKLYHTANTPLRLLDMEVGLDVLSQ